MSDDIEDGPSDYRSDQPAKEREEQPTGDTKDAPVRSGASADDYLIESQKAESARIARSRHYCLVAGVVIVGALAIAAIILPFFFHKCK